MKRIKIKNEWRANKVRMGENTKFAIALIQWECGQSPRKKNTKYNAVFYIGEFKYKYESLTARQMARQVVVMIYKPTTPTSEMIESAINKIKDTGNHEFIMFTDKVNRIIERGKFKGMPQHEVAILPIQCADDGGDIYDRIIKVREKHHQKETNK